MKDYVYTLTEFCAHHSISRGEYYKLRKQNRLPEIIEVDRRKYITKESAEKWRKTHKVNS